MSFASERLYSGYIRRNMGRIVRLINVKEIVPYLPCLTDSDREGIGEIKHSGNMEAGEKLLPCLRRRENWPERLIRALELCEQPTLASEIRAEYEALQGPRNAAPVAPAVSAHPSHTSDPGPIKHPVQATLQTQEVDNPLPQPDPQSVAMSVEQNLNPVNMESSGAAAPSQNPAAPSGLGLPGASSQVSDYTSLPPSLPPASETPTPGPAVSSPEPQKSPVKPPVQYSNPPATNATQQPVEYSDPTVNQITANDRQTHPAQGSSAQQPSRLTRHTAGADHTDSPATSSLTGGPMSEDEFLSKPWTLLSCNALAQRPSENPAFLAPVIEEPSSGDSCLLQLSSF